MCAAKHLKPWKPGESANPGGRPKLPENLRGIHSLTRTEVCKLVSKYARMNQDELTLAVSNSSTPVLEIAIASIFSKAIQYGDYTRLSFLLDRAIGKVETLPETNDEKAARQEIQDLSTQELIKLVKEKLPDIEDKKE